MNKGIFSSWFREFATLVFTQTVQAFLLAIVMSIIISCIQNANGNGINAAGLLAIIALSSFGKIELLVKNIFGVTSGFGDPSLRNGAGSLVGTAMAFRGMKNISDNAGKMIKGTRLRKEGEAGLKALNADGGKIKSDVLNPDGTNNDVNNVGKQTSAAVEEQVVKLQTLGDINALTEAIRGLKTATETANKTDAQSKMEKYQDMINEGRNMQKTALHESVGATIGGTAGAIIGLAKGDDIAQNALAGAGIGDSAGKAVVQHQTETREYKKRMEKISIKGQENYDNSLKEIEEFKKAAAHNVATGKVKDVNAYNKAVVDAVSSYKQGIADNMKGAANKAIKKPQAVKSSLNDLNRIQNQLDKNSDAGNH